MSVKVRLGISISSGTLQRLEVIVKDDDWEKSGDGVLEGDAVHEGLGL